MAFQGFTPLINILTTVKIKDPITACLVEKLIAITKVHKVITSRYITNESEVKATNWIAPKIAHKTMSRVVMKQPRMT